MIRDYPLKFRLAIQSIQRVFMKHFNEPDIVFFKAQIGNEIILNLSDNCVTVWWLRVGPLGFCKIKIGY